MGGIPTKSMVIIHKKQNRICLNSGASGLHPNHLWFKYYWWVYTEDDILDCDDWDIKIPKKKIFSGAEFVKLQDDLHNKKIVHYYYNMKFYRPHETSPFDLNRLQREHFEKFGTELQIAPHYDEDTNPAYWELYK